MRYFAILLIALLSSPSWATSPPIPPDAVLLDEAPCVDRESGEQGICQVGRTPEGVTYLLFWQDRKPVLLRRLIPGEPYETIWRYDGKPTPAGTPL